MGTNPIPIAKAWTRGPTRDWGPPGRICHFKVDPNVDNYVDKNKIGALCLKTHGHVDNYPGNSVDNCVDRLDLGERTNFVDRSLFRVVDRSVDKTKKSTNLKQKFELIENDSKIKLMKVFVRPKQAIEKQILLKLRERWKSLPQGGRQR